MPAYRLYYLGEDGHIIRAVELDCLHDGQAVSEAERRADGRPMELWERARKVQVFEAPADPAVRRRG